MAQNDADELLILSLRRSALPVPATLKTFEGIAPEALVSIVVAAVRLIYGAQAGGAVVPALADRLPVNISQRHKVRRDPDSSTHVTPIMSPLLSGCDGDRDKRSRSGLHRRLLVQLVAVPFRARRQAPLVVAGWQTAQAGQRRAPAPKRGWWPHESHTRINGCMARGAASRHRFCDIDLRR